MPSLLFIVLCLSRKAHCILPTILEIRGRGFPAASARWQQKLQFGFREPLLVQLGLQLASRRTFIGWVRFMELVLHDMALLSKC